ncbi:MAG: hypothetical protein SXA11_00180 [Cyanobacteriota bacterium]|nr:hypothetical protein [Cyanobacteriota bacterium]
MINLIIAKNFENLNPQTKKAAEQAVRGFNGFLKNTFQEMLHQGRTLNQLQGKMQQELGKSDGKITFLWWLNSEQWQHTQTLARTLMSIAKKFEKLPGRLKNELRDKLNGWSLSAIKELLSAGRDVINKLKHRPTSAAQVRKAKEEALLLERPLTEELWQELQESYDLGEGWETIKEETDKIASQENNSPKYKHALLALRDLGIASTKTARKTKSKTANTSSSSEIILELANLAIRNSELKEALASAPEEIADSIILQIKSNENRIKELRVKCPDKLELLDGGSGKAIAELEEQLIALQEQNEKLEKQVRELTAAKAEIVPSSTEALEKTAADLTLLLAQLEQKNDDLKWKLDDLEDTYRNTRVRLEKRIKEKEELAEDNRTLVRKISELNQAQWSKDTLIEKLLQLDRIQTLEKPEVGNEVIVIKGNGLGMSGMIKEYSGEVYGIEVTSGNRSKTFFKKAEDFIIRN